ncbi:2-oxopent-4-enoate hydratase [Cupriavidus pinatubonensis]|uniref:2-hydroxyhexa-2,4-dienoate hydratase n=1 Tax=Cupriavidus pinatubonensis TaxID=248026 RepID=A0ABM8Y132_9BURK|nr:2-oxopent-4-enoate hydratase [Cupriavidus pinatubonensis]CAG9186430.1 2-hydroxyhexa-2,4-dienoate hydratase [Cupriavidus pinatubonensis]
MTADLITSLSNELHHALVTRLPVPPLSGRGLSLGIDDAYRIQQGFIAHRIAAGDRITGKKIGVTSQAVQQMLDVHQPDFGILLQSMHYTEGMPIPTDTLIQPRAEGEIAFFLRRDLRGPGVTRDEVLDATESVAACFEIVDSRIRDWRIRIEDTVADNASCGVYVLGDERVSPHALNLAACAMTLEKNGECVATGSGSAALGHPADAVAWLANTLGSFGIPLLAGETILSGSLAALVPVQAGDRLSMQISGIGSCTAQFI